MTMFEGLGKSKFFNKCKSKTKLTLTRLERIKNRRNAMQKYLKSDILDLLKNGLNNNAYDRGEEFLAELNLTSCYEIVEKFCVRILNNVSVMNKQRECPENCLEAVASLNFAAARFGDLPELLDLRSIFTKRYGTSLDSYVNKELVDKFKSVHLTMDMKIQLMEDIAQESGVQWSPSAAEEKENLPSTYAKGSVTDEEFDEEFQPHKNADDSPKSEDTENLLSPKYIEQYLEERSPFRSLKPERYEVANENVEDKEITQCKMFPPPPYRRPYVDQTRNDNKSASLEQQETTKGHHIRSSSAQTKSTKLPDYDDLVARLAAFRQEW